MGELVSINIYVSLAVRNTHLWTKYNLMFVCLFVFLLGIRLIWGACIQRWGSMRWSQRSPRKQNLSCSTCLDPLKTAWAMKTVSYIIHTTYCIPYISEYFSSSVQILVQQEEGSMKILIQWKHLSAGTKHSIQNTIKDTGVKKQRKTVTIGVLLFGTFKFLYLWWKYYFIIY